MKIIIIIAGVIIYTAFILFIMGIFYHWGYGDLRSWLKKLFKLSIKSIDQDDPKQPWNWRK